MSNDCFGGIVGKIHPPLPVKLFVGVLTSLPEFMTDVERRLSEVCGVVDRRSETYPFDQTQYYDSEMGRPIQRVFLSFEKLISPLELASLKVKTNEIESWFAHECTQVARPVNLDPGYLDQAKVALASTKDFSHRVVVSAGIYVEVTMHYEAGQWRSWPWTFPDFRSGRYNAFFSELRREYRIQLKSSGGKS
jgi:hypothetical protein